MRDDVFNRSASAVTTASTHPLGPIPVSQWETLGFAYPTVYAWRNMLRPENMRNQLVEAGVARRVNGRWLIFPDKWQQFVTNSHQGDRE